MKGGGSLHQRPPCQDEGVRSLRTILALAVLAGAAVAVLTAATCGCGYRTINTIHLRVVDAATGATIPDPTFPFNNGAHCTVDAGTPCEVWVVREAEDRAVYVRAPGYEEGKLENPDMGSVTCGEGPTYDATLRLERATPDAGAPDAH
jgi:hypothetical protein